MRPIREIARDLGIKGQLIPYGELMAKVPIDEVSRMRGRRGKLILVTGMTPTPHGEGKTVMSIGLSMALNKRGLKSVACIRQPSLGPVFGIKGGGAGGGKTCLEPMQQINMRFTGDIDAIGGAHNLLSAMVDNHIFHGNELSIDPAAIVWPRAVDMEDRALRQITVALGPKNGVSHSSGFVISAASEVMAILCLSRDYADLKQRLGSIIVAYSSNRRPVHSSEVRCVGAMAALLRDAFLPNLVQTSEGTPALVHGGPFGNIAHGTCSLVSMELGLGLADYVVVEAGFGSDLGAEKFVDIAARTGGLRVDAAVLVVTVRALRHHGGSDSTVPQVEAVRRGLENLGKHIENVRALGLSPIVAINRFPTDDDDEIRAIAEFCRDQGVASAASTSFNQGGKGSEELAELVIEVAGRGSDCRPLYDLAQSTKQKVETLVTKLYGGTDVSYTEDAEGDIERIAELGLVARPVCMAKTPLSLSDDPTKLGRPRDFAVTVRRVEPAGGAGFNIVYLGEIVTMPGLPKVPAAEHIQLGDDGVITGVT